FGGGTRLDHGVLDERRTVFDGLWTVIGHELEAIEQGAEDATQLYELVRVACREDDRAAHTAIMPTGGARARSRARRRAQRGDRRPRAAPASQPQCRGVLRAPPTARSRTRRCCS